MPYTYPATAAANPHIPELDSPVARARNRERGNLPGHPDVEPSQTGTPERVPDWARGYRVSEFEPGLGWQLEHCAPDETTLEDIKRIRKYFSGIEPGVEPCNEAAGTQGEGREPDDDMQAGVPQRTGFDNPFAIYPQKRAFNDCPLRDSPFDAYLFSYNPCDQDPSRPHAFDADLPSFNPFDADLPGYNPMRHLPVDRKFRFSPGLAREEDSGIRPMLFSAVNAVSLVMHELAPALALRASQQPTPAPPAPPAPPLPAAAPGTLIRLSMWIIDHGHHFSDRLDRVFKEAIDRWPMFPPGSDALPIDPLAGKDIDAGEERLREKRYDSGLFELWPRWNKISKGKESVTNTVTSARVPADLNENTLLSLAANKTEAILDALRVYRDPVIDPLAYINGKIRDAVVRHGGNPGVIDGSTKIPIGVRVPLGNNRMAEALEVIRPSSQHHILGHYSVFDIVTREYLRDLKNYASLQIEWPENFPAGLGEHFESADIQAMYAGDLQTFAQTPKVEASLTMLFGAFARGHAARYRDENRSNRTGEPRTSAQAVEQFLEGTRQAGTMSWDGCALSNTVFIPSDSSPTVRFGPNRREVRGVMYFIDDMRWYDVRLGGAQIIDERTAGLAGHIKKHLPLYDQLRYDDNLSPHAWFNLASSPGMYRLSYQPVDDIGHALYRIFLTTLESNMDALAKSDAELGTETALCWLETFGTVLSIALIPLGALGSASLAARVAAHSATGVLIGTATSVVPNAILARLADRPEDAEEFVTNAVAGALFETAGAVAPNLVLKAVRRVPHLFAKIHGTMKQVIDNARPHVPDNGPALGTPHIAVDASALRAGSAASAAEALPAPSLQEAPIVTLKNLENWDLGLPPASKADIAKVADEAKGIPGYRDFTETPHGKCEQAAIHASKRFSRLGYWTETAGLYVWKDAYDTFPRNHFVVRVWRNTDVSARTVAEGHEPIVIDLTAGQFAGPRLAGEAPSPPLIAPEKEWLASLTRLPQMENRLVSHHWFRTQSEAVNAYSSLRLKVPVYQRGYPKTVQPEWYKSAARETLFAKIRKRHAEASERHILEMENAQLQQQMLEPGWKQALLQADFAQLSVRLPYSTTHHLLRPELAGLLHAPAGPIPLNETQREPEIVFTGIDLRGIAETVDSPDMLELTHFPMPANQAGLRAWPLDQIDASLHQAQASAHWSSRLERARKDALDTRRRWLETLPEHDRDNLVVVKHALGESRKRLAAFERSLAFKAGKDIHLPLLIGVNLPADDALIQQTGTGSYRIPVYVHKSDIRVVLAPRHLVDDMQTLLDTVSPMRRIPVLGVLPDESGAAGSSTPSPPPDAATSSRVSTEASATRPSLATSSPALSVSARPTVSSAGERAHVGLPELARIRQAVTEDPACQVLAGDRAAGQSGKAAQAAIQVLQAMGYPTKLRWLLLWVPSRQVAPVEHLSALVTGGDHTVVVDLTFGQFNDDTSIDGVAVDYEKNWIANLAGSRTVLSRDMAITYKDFASFADVSRERRKPWPDRSDPAWQSGLLTGAYQPSRYASYRNPDDLDEPPVL